MAILADRIKSFVFSLHRVAARAKEGGRVESQGECLVFLHVWNSSDALRYVETLVWLPGA